MAASEPPIRIPDEPTQPPISRERARRAARSLANGWHELLMATGFAVPPALAPPTPERICDYPESKLTAKSAMAKPNYGFDKRQRELKKSKQQEEKRLKKLARTAPAEDTPPTEPEPQA